PEAPVVVSEPGVVADAVGGAEPLRIAGPRAAADHPAAAVTRCPRRTICWRTLIVLVPAILSPIPDVTMYVADAEGVGGELTRRCRVGIIVVVVGKCPTLHPFDSSFCPLIRTIAIPAQRLRVVPKAVARRRARPRRVLAFSFGQ